MLSTELLDALAEATKAAAGKSHAPRAMLLQLDEVLSTLQGLIHEAETAGIEEQAVPQEVVCCLRVLRNACAAGAVAADHLASVDMMALVCALVELLGTAKPQVDAGDIGQPALVCSQLLANATQASAVSAAAAWHHLFPKQFVSLASFHKGEGVASGSTPRWHRIEAWPKSINLCRVCALGTGARAARMLPASRWRG